MSDTKVSIDQLGTAIEKELTLYSETVITNIKKQAAESIDQLVTKTKATAPVGHRKKHYRSNIKSKKEKETANMVSYLWYVNGSDYALTHLLENGHMLRNGGRYSGTHFLKDASDPILEEFEKKCEEICQNG